MQRGFRGPLYNSGDVCLTNQIDITKAEDLNISDGKTRKATHGYEIANAANLVLGAKFYICHEHFLQVYALSSGLTLKQTADTKASGGLSFARKDCLIMDNSEHFYKVVKIRSYNGEEAANGKVNIA